MGSSRNATGRPLAASAWLEAHHRAKLPERQAFCRRLSELEPTRVVDLGCATGLWLDELDKVLPDNCEFVGLDSDDAALEEAEARASSWSRRATFSCVDVSDPGANIPAADLTLLFNLSSYLKDLDRLLTVLSRQTQHLAVRQYDGAALRFGPMRTEDRALIDESLRAALAGSSQFRHYDLDRLYRALEHAPFRSRDVSFELFARTSPYPAQFMDYYVGTLDWTAELLSDNAHERLSAWRDGVEAAGGTYFTEVDLVAVLSS